MAKGTAVEPTTDAPEAPAVKADPAAPAAPKAGTTAEQHAVDAETPDWLFASTKAYHGWPVGKELSRADYDAAVDKAANCSTASLKDASGKDTSGLISKKK